MKRKFIPLLFVLTAACTNYIDYDFGKEEARPMVQGWLDTASEEQTVRISLSEAGLVKPVEDARVVCTVNGKEVADVSRHFESQVPQPGMRPSELLLSRQLSVSFPLSLRPGDRVQLSFEANQGAYKAASAELTVPEPVTISRFDTARVTVRYVDRTDRYLQLLADVPDRKGEDNWYSISLREISEGTYAFRDGGPDISVSVDLPRHISEMDDPILLDGNRNSSGGFELFDFSGDGVFACFSDSQFRDATAHLKMNAFSSWNNEGADFENLAKELRRTYDSDKLAARGFVSCTARHWLEVRLSHCTQETYSYLRALRTVSSSSYRPDIMEPLVIPSNIEGGVGFVGVVNTASARIELPSEIQRY